MSDDQNFQAIFDALPGNSILLKTDEPTYTVLAASPSCLAQAGHTKESMIGKGVFEAFPANNADSTDTGNRDLKDSYQQVIAEKQTHVLPAHGYNWKNEDGSNTKHYRRVSNSPVFGVTGEVDYIIHTEEDSTYEIKAKVPEEKSKDSKKDYSLFMKAPIAVNILNGPELIIEMANASSLEIWGKGEEVMGQSLLKILPELVSQGYKDLAGQILKTGIPHHAYEQHVTLFRNGEEHDAYFNWVIQPFYQEVDGEATGIITFANEVTDQVGAKKREAEREQSFALATEIAELGIFTIDIKTDTATYSNKVMEWFGLSQATLLMPEVLSKVDSNDHSMVAETLKRSIAGEWDGRHDFVYRVANPKTGAVQYLRSIGQVLREDGVAVRLSGVIQNETAQVLSHKKVEESQQALLDLFEEAPVGITTIDASDDLIFGSVNAFYANLTGRSQEQLINKPLLEALPELKGQGFDHLLKEVIRTGVPFIANEAPVTVQKAGREETIYLNYTYQPQRNAEDKITGVLVVATDVTQQVLALHMMEDVVTERTRDLAETNQTLKTTNSELQRSNANLEEFAHAASHDLKEPVRKIHFYTHQLKEQLRTHLSEAEIRLFNRIENATERMGSLIDDLLLYSHVSQRPHEKESVDLNEKIKRVLEDLELDIEEKGALVKLDKLPVLKGYPRQLQQLFQNLISNALKYSKAGVSPHIDISAKRAEENNRKFSVISVRDNGIGFDEQYSEKIFQMFGRLHGKGQYSGTGVGLSIVKKVVENHGGFIRVESAVGEGSVFRIYLPAKAD